MTHTIATPGRTLAGTPAINLRVVAGAHAQLQAECRARANRSRLFLNPHLLERRGTSIAVVYSQEIATP